MSYHLGSVDPDEHAGYAEDGEEPQPRRRSLVASLLAVAVMAAFAGGLWFAYKAGARHAGAGGEVPLIRAEPGPLKVKPDNPGGLEVPDRDMLIYREARPKVERLLPPPETPLPRPAPPPAPPTPVAAAPAPAPAVPSATEAAPPAPAPTPAAAAPGAPAATPAAPSATPQQAAAEPPAAPAAAAEPAAPSAAAATGGARLLLGSLRSQALAEAEWQRIKHANGDLVGQLEVAILRSDLGDKGVFWRIESKPVADPIAALELCEALKERKIGCAIAR